MTKRKRIQPRASGRIGRLPSITGRGMLKGKGVLKALMEDRRREREL